MGQCSDRGPPSLPPYPVRNERERSSEGKADERMAMVTIFPSLLLVTAPKPLSYSTSKIRYPTLPPSSSALLRPLYYQRRRRCGRVSPKRSQLWRVYAASGDALPSEATIEAAQQVPPAAAQDGAVSTVISALLFFAFIGLSIVTIGVIPYWKGF